MKKPLHFSSFILLSTLLMTFQFSHAQVGIGTITPNGALDIQSSNSGLILPRVNLTSAALEGPVSNPSGGAILPGTLVYNLATITTGSPSNYVYPGIYAWEGSRWVELYTRKQEERFEQSTLDFRTSSNNNSVVYENIPGLNNETFTPLFTGTYRIDVKANYGAGYMSPPVVGNINVGTTEGYFNFNFDGSSSLIYAHSYSAYNNTGGGSATNYYGIWNQSSYTMDVNLVAGNTYNFNLAFDQFYAQYFVNNGNSGTGRGHVGYDIPCYVEFKYIRD